LDKVQEISESVEAFEAINIYYFFPFQMIIPDRVDPSSMEANSKAAKKGMKS
jgi:hypothetical protein